MQTFLPYPRFERTARVLDAHHLGEQRVEAHVLRARHAPGYGWRLHPAVEMWRGHEAP
jgi:pyrimidine dimer DNA glycosylase